MAQIELLREWLPYLILYHCCLYYDLEVLLPPVTTETTLPLLWFQNRLHSPSNRIIHVCKYVSSLFFHVASQSKGSLSYIWLVKSKLRVCTLTTKISGKCTFLDAKSGGRIHNVENYNYVEKALKKIQVDINDRCN